MNAYRNIMKLFALTLGALLSYFTPMSHSYTPWKRQKLGIIEINGVVLNIQYLVYICILNIYKYITYITYHIQFSRRFVKSRNITNVLWMSFRFIYIQGISRKGIQSQHVCIYIYIYIERERVDICLKYQEKWKNCYVWE